MLHFVGFDNYLPRPTTKPSLDDESAIDHVRAESAGALEHIAQLNLRETSVLHPLLDMGCELKLPLPPTRERHGATLPRGLLPGDASGGTPRQWRRRPSTRALIRESASR